ncbi:MAG: hypothetical protein KZQ88_17690 [Candidatus Thiodiazotropha sp. (ex Dulcina madagascariensis)]|nr:hypothetical protein [Candidatus Thiodiazotropha sp. (ex Epidulcina cf. delphinae)]MCU7924526.1 hypothetical protein [Candidatus Thiodiazotropha sp. (ex Dulcina madagascariensis)]MCU7926920.1 hypothetical protein [Candidatus Thiodiazotropha sp. (ex Dulcina madagascariensis)]
MKSIMTGLSGLTGLLASSPLLAHVGEHAQAGWLSGVVHLLAEHGYLLLAIVAGGLVFRQVFRVRS